jgi:uncharacterized protein with GYD domain
VLIRTRRGEFDEAVEKLKQIKGVKRVFPVLGRYDVVIDLEATDSLTLGNTVLKMGRMAGVVFTETLVEIHRKEG